MSVMPVTGAQLGLFTRYFVEGMLGRADTDSGNGNGSIELFELKDFLASKVGYQARRRYSRTQIPEVMGRLDRVMSASLDPGFSFGDPDLEPPLSRNQRPANRSFRADERSAPATQTPTPASQEEPSLLNLLLRKSDQKEEENEYND